MTQAQRGRRGSQKRWANANTGERRKAADCMNAGKAAKRGTIVLEARLPSNHPVLLAEIVDSVPVPVRHLRNEHAPR
jgi:hypothetical protein